MIKCLLLPLLLLSCVIRLNSQSIIYVDADNVGTIGINNGSSWSEAFTLLQFALNQATGGDTILVAEGTYRTHTSDQEVSFELIPDVVMLGGFDPSNGITALEDRDWADNTTILSGDIGQIGDTSDNAYHVIYAGNPLITNSTVVDGFTITGGNAKGPFIVSSNERGGGIYLNKSSPTIRNCRVIQNYANAVGGGLYILNDIVDSINSTILINCLISENYADHAGGIYASDWSGSISKGSIINNKAGDAGGISLSRSNVSFYKTSISENEASYAVGGCIFYESTCNMVQSKITFNKAYDIGGIKIDEYSILNAQNTIIASNSDTLRSGALYSTRYSVANFTNCTIASNESLFATGGINIGSATTCNLSNSILALNLINGSIGLYSQFYDLSSGIINVQHSLVQGGGGTDLGGNIDALPDFADTTNFTLSSTSPAIDAGSNDLVIGTADIAGVPRILEGGSGIGRSKTVDMGASEYFEGFHWTGNGDGYDWKDPSNWSQLRLPNTTDDVLLYTTDKVEIPPANDGFAKSVILGGQATLHIQNTPGLMRARLQIHGSTEDVTIINTLPGINNQLTAGLINQGLLINEGRLSFENMESTSNAIINRGTIVNENNALISIEDTVATAILTYGDINNLGNIKISESFSTGIDILKTMEQPLLNYLNLQETPISSILWGR